MPRLPTTINLSARSSFMPIAQLNAKDAPLFQTDASIQNTFLAHKIIENPFTARP
jgi:hypothetical protein